MGCDCDRYMEIWNLVFSQFDADGKGHYERLARPNIDTGMGLERLACVMQGVGNLFEVDTVQSVLHHVEHIAGKTYGANPKEDISIRVITDHIRSCTFMVSDGILPSNEGRGYVLRRLLRRAARHGKLLGVNEPFLYQVVDTVIHENECQYPDLREKQTYITKVIRTEEENFARTIDGGMKIYGDMLSAHKAKGETVFSGEDAFKLYDTFGFPIDLTAEMAAEEGMTIDEIAAGIRWHYEGGRNRLANYCEVTQGRDALEEGRKAAEAAGLPFCEHLADGGDNELSPYVYDGSMTLADREKMQQAREAFEKLADALREIAAKLAEALKPVINAVLSALKKLWKVSAKAIGVPPKWLHLAAHAKKARTRKKYRNRIRRYVFEALAAEGGGGP